MTADQGQGVARSRLWILLGAMVIGLLARFPGVFWGVNFPTGWTGHHIDEYTHYRLTTCLMNPSEAGTCQSNYPRGTAAHVVLPLLGMRAIQGKLNAPLPGPETIILTGRVISVLYGVATILVLYLFTGVFFKDQAVAYLSAWILALGGLHVTQSHFFLADVPVLFWTLLGLFLLSRHIEGGDGASPHYLNAAALCIGVTFGIKLSIVAVPSLAIAAWFSKPRLARLLYVGVFFVAGVCLVSLDAYSLFEIYKTATRSSAGDHGFEYSRLAGAGIYLLEAPSLLSFPIALLAAAGTLLFCRRLFGKSSRQAARLIVLTVILPAAITLWAVVFKVDNFPRHLLPFVPWAAVTAAWALTLFARWMERWRIRQVWIVAPVILYLGIFVFDGERVFWKEPRNAAERWILDNFPKSARISWVGARHNSFENAGLSYTPYPGSPPPDVIVCEMHYANMFLSGMGWRDSYPSDRTKVWPWFSAPGALQAWQSLFKGTSAYREGARFREGYFMPEYTWTDRWIGNRSRNYVAEVVIFRRDAERGAVITPAVSSSTAAAR